MLIDLLSTEQKVQAWAEWSREGNPIHQLMPNSPALALMRMNMGGVISVGNISDDDALLLDAVISRLKARQPDLHKAIILYYVHSFSQRELARKFGDVSVQYINQWLKQGIAWIEGQLDAKSDAA